MSPSSHTLAQRSVTWHESSHDERPGTSAPRALAFACPARTWAHADCTARPLLPFSLPLLHGGHSQQHGARPCKARLQMQERTHTLRMLAVSEAGAMMQLFRPRTSWHPQDCVHHLPTGAPSLSRTPTHCGTTNSFVGQLPPAEHLVCVHTASPTRTPPRHHTSPRCYATSMGVAAPPGPATDAPGPGPCPAPGSPAPAPADPAPGPCPAAAPGAAAP